MSIANHIRNYYEQLVAEEILRALSERQEEPAVDYMADVACIALNHLPARYIRFEVDMAFYMSPAELATTTEAVHKAVQQAIQYVDSHRRSE